MVHRLHVVEDEIAHDSHLMMSMLSKHKPRPPPPGKDDFVVD